MSSIWLISLQKKILSWQKNVYSGLKDKNILIICVHFMKLQHLNPTPCIFLHSLVSIAGLKIMYGAYPVGVDTPPYTHKKTNSIVRKKHVIVHMIDMEHLIKLVYFLRAK